MTEFNDDYLIKFHDFIVMKNGKVVVEGVPYCIDRFTHQKNLEASVAQRVWDIVHQPSEPSIRQIVGVVYKYESESTHA
jgi:hypothetical protein